MSKQTSLYRHRVIIKQLRFNNKTFKELAAKLSLESEITGSDLSISLRTFQRDIKEISMLYGIEITYNRSKKVYQISFDEGDQFSERMFEALDLYQTLNQNQLFSDYIQFDTRKPMGIEYLNDIFKAIREHHKIKFYYQKFGNENGKLRTIEPYLLKEFRRRWYVFGFDTYKMKVRIFGLDRITGLQILSQKFEHPILVDVDTYFKDCFGIIGPDNGKPQDIILKFYQHQGEYIRTLPLHFSQKIMEDNGQEMVVYLHLIPNFDFIMELLWYGEYVEIITPISLAKNIKHRFKNALSIYDKEIEE